MNETTNIAGNRAARRAAGQRGPAPTMSKGKRAGFAAVAAVAAGALLAPMALADPMINPAPGGSNPAPTTPNPSAPPRAAVPQVAPSNVGPAAIPDPPATRVTWRPNPATTNAPVYTPTYYNPPTAYNPVQVQGPVVIPEPVRPMILPEPGMVRIGTYQEVKPPWMTMAELNSVNRWAAYFEAQIAQYWIDQGMTESQADRQAATEMAAGLAGGAIGAGAGAAAGAAIGSGIGGAVGAATGIFWLPVPIGGQIAWVSQTAAGGMIGGGIGAVALGVPAALGGAALGATFGAGDPDQPINQPWTYRDGSGEIVEIDNKLEFDWNGQESIPELAGAPDAHINIQVKEDDTWVMKTGNERWFAATADQRDKHFYGEMNAMVPGMGDAVKADMENEHGLFQTTVRDIMEQVTRDDPGHAQFNDTGDIEDTSARAERVHYGYTSTPDPWDEPRYLDEDNPGAVGGAEDELVNPGPPIDDDGLAVTTYAAPVEPAAPAAAPAPAPAPVAAQVPAAAPVPAPAPAPAPVVQTGIAEVDTFAADVQTGIDAAVADVNAAVADFIPGIPGA